MPATTSSAALSSTARQQHCLSLHYRSTVSCLPVAAMNPVITCVLLLGATMSYAQVRSPYAPRPVGVVNVLPRFQDTEGDIPSRLGDEGTPKPPPSTPSSLAGANVDPELASRVAEWPEAHRPFWYENAQAIRNSQYQPVNSLPGPPPRSPFAANVKN